MRPGQDPDGLPGEAKGTLRPQRIPGTKGSPETEETELEMREPTQHHEVNQAQNEEPEPEK